MSEKKSKINYKVFIIMGTSFMGLGVIFMLAVNTVMGIVLLAAGLGNLAIGLSAGKKEN